MDSAKNDKNTREGQSQYEEKLRVNTDFKELVKISVKDKSKDSEKKEANSSKKS